jgi:tRNA A-37 threonylcarbamoyl transferase component Bud32/dienelactone hydrolase
MLGQGRRLGAYEISTLIGSGAMGEVYRARDTRLDRTVAIKIISQALQNDRDWRRRFDHEARAISGLNHPNICTLHDIGTQDGVAYLVMECLEGETLADRLRARRPAVNESISIAAQIADALTEAHRHGLIHRDIKPANVFVTTRGDAKVLDFGLARTEAIVEPIGSDMTTAAVLPTLTMVGSTVGTFAYMSPEQLRGAALDHRSDLFSLGVVLYEMLAGARPFRGESTIAVAEAILREEPPALRDKGVPPGLNAVVSRLLAKDRDRRYQTAADVRRDLGALQQSISLRPSARSLVGRLAVGVAIAALLVVVASIWRRSSRERWALDVAAPEIERLINDDDNARAAVLAKQARALLPNDPALEQLWIRATGAASIVTEPSGATVSIRAYAADQRDSESLGTTPLKTRVANAERVWTITKPGFVPVTLISRAPNLTITLRPVSAVPSGMVSVLGGQTSLAWPFGLAEALRVENFLIDQNEVTNEAYQRFVDAGGYQNRAWWPDAFVKDGRVVSFANAVAAFVDTTGRPGPATWSVGSFPKGMEKNPVAGVSWYEASAYARFAGKTLPTVYHWRRAAQTTFAKLIVPAANFSGTTTLPVGGSLSGFGTADMAGNVKEWCLNESNAGTRFILGGGFGESTYLFDFMDTTSPWERRTNYGFRTVKLDAPPSTTAAKLERPTHDITKDSAVSDEIFAAFKGLYAYDRTELHAQVEGTETSDESTHERIAYDAAYGNERVLAHLFLPKHGTPPFQAVVYIPGAGSLLTDHLDAATWFEGVEGGGDFLLKSGRAVLVPVLKGMWERRDGVKPGGPTGNPPALWRDHVIMWSKDLGRSLDYLQTRPDIDSAKIAYYGFSFGGAIAPIMLAMEPRFQAAILSSGGLHFERPLPEADGINFATRVRLPLLMLNGRYDSLFPIDPSQLAIFRRVATAESDKRHVIYEGGHGALPHGSEVRETLDWLDKYLGPVRQRTGS